MVTFFRSRGQAGKNGPFIRNYGPANGRRDPDAAKTLDKGSRGDHG